MISIRVGKRGVTLVEPHGREARERLSWPRFWLQIPFVQGVHLRARIIETLPMFAFHSLAYSEDPASQEL
jgi:hypothetical protein